LHGLNFTEEEFDKPINDFSGGQKTRLSLAQMLLSRVFCPPLKSLMGLSNSSSVKFKPCNTVLILLSYY
jgi:hypothetical protein